MASTLCVLLVPFFCCCNFLINNTVYCAVNCTNRPSKKPLCSSFSEYSVIWVWALASRYLCLCDAALQACIQAWADNFTRHPRLWIFGLQKHLGVSQPSSNQRADIKLKISCFMFLLTFHQSLSINLPCHVLLVVYKQQRNSHTDNWEHER